MKALTAFFLFLSFSFAGKAQIGDSALKIPVEKDAVLHSVQADVNFGSTEELIAMAWTCGLNDTCLLRSLFRFNLNEIPKSKPILRATLSLYANTSPSNSSHFGFNEAQIKRVSEEWEEGSVNWDNQPATSTESMIELPMSDSSSQDYIDIDVTEFILDMINSPLPNHGFMLQLKTERIFRSINFASSNHPDVALHPVLRVELDATATGLNDQPLQLAEVRAFPNPFSNHIQLSYQLKEGGMTTVELIDSRGARSLALLNAFQPSGAQQLYFDLSTYNLAPGMYLLSIRTESGQRVNKKLFYQP